MAYVVVLGIPLFKLFYISSSAFHLTLLEETVNVLTRKYNYNSNFGHLDLMIILCPGAQVLAIPARTII